MRRGRQILIPLVTALLLFLFGGVACNGRSTSGASGGSGTPASNDTTAPTVTNVTSSSTNGTWIIGQSISIEITFSESVTVTGSPTLTLETGTTDQTATYASGSGTDTLTFTYVVQGGDSSADLDYTATSALALSGGTITDAAGNEAVLTLASPGATGSLGMNKAIIVDGIVPTVTGVTSPSANATYSLAQTISIEVSFSEAVAVTGVPTLTLETGTTDHSASYVSGTGTTTLTFDYVVKGWDVSLDLEYTSTGAMNLAGGSIKDVNGNSATLTLPSPGAAGSLSNNKNIVVAGVVPLLSVSQGNTCATHSNLSTRCWGLGNVGQSGNRSLGTWGNQPNEMGIMLPGTDVGTGLVSTQLSSGLSHVCAVLSNSTLKCWGNNLDGQLGRDNTTNHGGAGTHMGDNLAAINLGVGRSALSVSAGRNHTCAILDDNTLKCWGLNSDGRLGYDGVATLGDEPGEMAALSTVNLGVGRTASSVSAGSYHTCAVLDNGTLKCWGLNSAGQLGRGNTASQGDGAGEMAALTAISLGTGRTALRVSAGGEHTCAILDNNALKCWGDNTFGQLGYGDTTRRGDGANEMGDNLPSVNLGTNRYAVSIHAAPYHTCAVLDNGALKCWGLNTYGQLGTENTNTLGDNTGEMGDSLAAISLGTGRTALTVRANEFHTCAVLDQGSIKCWGRNNNGQLGYEDTTNRGDLPNTMGNFLLGISL